MERLENPRIARELRAETGGERAQRVMLLELPSGRNWPRTRIPYRPWLEAKSSAGLRGRFWMILKGPERSFSSSARMPLKDLAS